jgi:hypothetical protein
MEAASRQMEAASRQMEAAFPLRAVSLQLEAVSLLKAVASPPMVQAWRAAVFRLKVTEPPAQGFAEMAQAERRAFPQTAKVLAQVFR